MVNLPLCYLRLEARGLCSFISTYGCHTYFIDRTASHAFQWEITSPWFQRFIIQQQLLRFKGNEHALPHNMMHKLLRGGEGHLPRSHHERSWAWQHTSPPASSSLECPPACMRGLHTTTETHTHYSTPCFCAVTQTPPVDWWTGVLLTGTQANST